MQARPIQVTGHESELGMWRLYARTPAPGLQDVVHPYVGYVERSPGPMRRRVVPAARVVLIVSFGPTIALADARRPDSPRTILASFVAGLHDGPGTTEYLGEQRGLQVDLTPLGAYALLGVPMDELAHRVTDLDAVLGGDAGLVERLHETPTWEARFDLLDEWLSGRLARGRAPSPDVSWAWGRLAATGGRLGIGALAEELGCSRRHLVARFRCQVGMPPKKVARILRFQRAVGLLAGGRASPARVAHTCGYFDQAHLVRDFREFAGCAPSEFLARRLPDGGGTSAE